jgi:hypothetical protein
MIEESFPNQPQMTHDPKVAPFRCENEKLCKINDMSTVSITSSARSVWGIVQAEIGKERGSVISGKFRTKVGC